jgi:hyperosmotically inducible protein
MKKYNEYQQKKVADNFLIMACILAGLGLVGCEEKGPAQKTGQKIDRAEEKVEHKIEQLGKKADVKIEDAKTAVVDKAESTAEYLEDSVATQKVKSALENDLMLKASRIEVTTLNGIVKLTGSVDSEQSLGRAMEVAGGIEHVKSVETNLTVNSSAQDKK